MFQDEYRQALHAEVATRGSMVDLLDFLNEADFITGGTDALTTVATHENSLGSKGSRLRAFAAMHRSTGDMSRGLTKTANNHIKADGHSRVGNRFSMAPRQARSSTMFWVSRSPVP